VNSTNQAEYAAKIRNEFLIVGHCSQYAIIKDENGKLYYLLDENKVLEDGNVCDGTGLNTIDELPEIIRRAAALWYRNEG